MNNNTSRITEIGMIVLAALLIIGGVILIFFGKITFVEFSPFLVAVLGLFGINVAWKAPSPAQAQQLNTQLEQLNTQQQQIASVQALATQAVSAVQPLQEQAHTHPPVQQQPQFVQPMRESTPPVQRVDYGRHWGDSEEIAAIDTKRFPAVSTQS